MHASIWKFTGDPDDLINRYDAVSEEIPTDQFIAHLCLRAPDGIVIVDTCPSQEAFEAFAHGEAFRSARARHGLPEPTQLDDFPVHVCVRRRCRPYLGPKRSLTKRRPEFSASSEGR